MTIAAVACIVIYINPTVIVVVVYVNATIEEDDVATLHTSKCGIELSHRRASRTAARRGPSARMKYARRY